jgi:hypothetical protein
MQRIAGCMAVRCIPTNRTVTVRLFYYNTYGFVIIYFYISERDLGKTDKKARGH